MERRLRSATRKRNLNPGIAEDEHNHKASESKRRITSPNHFEPHISTKNLMDLEPFDVFPEIFRHFELRDFLNFSLVSKRVYDMVSPEIIRRSKISIERSSFSKVFELKSFKRKYDTVELDRMVLFDNTLDLMKRIKQFNLFKGCYFIITISDFLDDLPLLKDLDTFRGYGKLLFNYMNIDGYPIPIECQHLINDIVDFDTHHFNTLLEFSKIQTTLNFKGLMINYCSGLPEKDFAISLPNLEGVWINDLRDSGSIIENIVHKVLLKQTNPHLTTLALNNFSCVETVRDILKANFKTLKTIELFNYYEGFSLLPARPKTLRIETCYIDVSNFFKGQTNLEVLRMKTLSINREVLDELLCNQHLWNLTIRGCFFQDRTLRRKYIPIFSRLRNLVYYGHSSVIKFFMPHLENVSILELNSVDTRKITSQRNAVQIPRLQYLTLKENGGGLSTFFKNRTQAPYLKSLDIEFPGETILSDVKYLEDFNKEIKFLKIGNWLDYDLVKQILQNFTNLDSLILKYPRFWGLLDIIDIIFGMKRRVKYVKIIVYDKYGDFLGFRKDLKIFWKDVHIKGINKLGKSCCSLEILSNEKTVININEECVSCFEFFDL